MKKTIENAKALIEKYDFLNLSKSKKSTIFLFICLIAGMIFGTVSVSSISMEFIYKLDFIFLSDFKGRLSQSNTEIFISSLCILSIFALLLELCSLSCWGMIFIPFIMGFKGFGLGITAGYLYLIHGLKGIAFYLLILLPGIFISSIGLTIFSSQCIKFSISILKNVLSKEESKNLRYEIKNHLKKSGYCITILLMSSIIDVCFMIMFSRFFNF